MESDEKLLRAFGLALRQTREQKDISQDVLAELAGLHRTYIGSVERGERNLSLKNIAAIASALGTTGSKLLERAEVLAGGSTAKQTGRRK
jgi:transcriptional regulator with XRE-family HTH domain